MAQEKALSVAPIDPEKAAQVLAGLEAFDPRGLLRPEQIAGMCQRGQCFAVSGQAEAVYVLAVVNGVAWIDAAKKTGEGDASAAIDSAVTAQGKALGLRAIGTQTAHPGLVAKLKGQGWRVTGWILQKDIT